MKLRDALMQDERHLPTNRKELFFDKIFEDFGYLFKTGVVLLLFCLPYLLLMLMKDLFFIQMGEIVPEQEMDAFIRRYGLLFDFGGIICLVVAALGLAGTFRVIRQFAWKCGWFFVSEFKTGIRTSGKLFAVFGFITGIFLALNNLTLVGTQEVTVSGAITITPMVVAVFLLMPVMLLCFSQITVYNTTLLGSLRDCIWLYGRTLPKTLPIALVMELPLLLVFVTVPHTKYELIVVYIILVLPTMLFAWFLYCCSVFDKHINAKSYPDLVDRGLFKGEQRY